MLTTSDGWRRVIFPSSSPHRPSTCCKYCNLTDFCGIVKPNWLHDANFLGNTTVDGRICNHWQKQGGESNNWYAEVGTDMPCMYWEGCVRRARGTCSAVVFPFSFSSSLVTVFYSLLLPLSFIPIAPPRPLLCSYPQLPSSNYWRFDDPQAMSRNPIPSSVFAIPENCEDMCQTTRMPYSERLQLRADMERERTATASGGGAAD